MLICSATVGSSLPLNTSVSKPAWPSTTSLPSPLFQTNVSLPAPRNAVSAPLPPTTVSLPRAAVEGVVAGAAVEGVVAVAAEQMCGGSACPGRHYVASEIVSLPFPPNTSISVVLVSVGWSP